MSGRLDSDGSYCHLFTVSSTISFLADRESRLPPDEVQCMIGQDILPWSCQLVRMSFSGLCDFACSLWLCSRNMNRTCVFASHPHILHLLHITCRVLLVESESLNCFSLTWLGPIKQHHLTHHCFEFATGCGSSCGSAICLDELTMTFCPLHTS